MAARKTTDLTALTAPTANTLVAAVDLTEALPSNQNKKLTLSDLTKGLSAATTGAAGVVQLSTSTSSTSASLAATPSAVKSAYDLANTASTTASAALARSGGTMTGAITFAGAQPTATTSAAGIVQLSDSISSTSTTLAATANAVKTAYDRATNGLVTADTVKNSTSGTNVDFTGIPAGVKRVTVMLNGVSLSGTALIRFRLGDSGGFVTSGYNGAGSVISAGSATVNQTAGFDIYSNVTNASYVFSGAIRFNNITGNTWIADGVFCSHSVAWTHTVAGVLVMSNALTQVRVTTSNGTDTFDAGSINIFYES